MPTARTSGAANGSSMSAFGSVLAIARAAATIVAVAPTLDATSQLSVSERVIDHRRGAADVAQVGERRRLSSNGANPLSVNSSLTLLPLDLPAVVGQIRGRLLAVSQVDEVGEVEVEPVLAPTLGRRLHLLDGLLDVGRVDRRHALGGQPAAGAR